ncbi:MAG: hypothetical protein JWM55_1530 [Acidimicrobiaceae bacterium]|nr:hypothetical protein [Acidimicrobiaceae bacterium]
MTQEPRSVSGDTQPKYCYELSWSLPCTFEQLRDRLPVLLDYMSSNGCEWILKLSPHNGANSYVEVLITREGTFWPVFTFDLGISDHEILDLEPSELTPILGWDSPNASTLDQHYSGDGALNISSAISEIMFHSLAQVLGRDHTDACQVRLFSARPTAN